MDGGAPPAFPGARGYASRTIRLRFQFRDFHDYPGNAQLPLLKEDAAQFGDPAGYVVALIEADDVFRNDVLEYVAGVTSALLPEADFSRIRSITNVQVPRGWDDDVLTGPLFPHLPASDEALLEGKKAATGQLARRAAPGVARSGCHRVILQELAYRVEHSIVKLASGFGSREASLNFGTDGLRVRRVGYARSTATQAREIPAAPSGSDQHRHVIQAIAPTLRHVTVDVA